jgi:hypothetical protein
MTTRTEQRKADPPIERREDLLLPFIKGREAEGCVAHRHRA